MRIQNLFLVIFLFGASFLGACVPTGRTPSAERQEQIRIEYQERISWENTLAVLEAEQQEVDRLRAEQRKKAIEAQNSARMATVTAVQSFHNRCEEFGSDVQGRAAAGCPLSGPQQLELRNLSLYRPRR